MKQYITLRDYFTVLRKRLRWWLCAAVIAALALMVSQVFSEDRMTVTAQVNFSYDGIESGLDPSGNRFDVGEMKSDAIIQAAAEAAGFSSSLEDVARIQDAIEISGAIPRTVYESITSYDSIYGEDGVETTKKEREASYFPSQYSLTLHYTKAGISAGKAKLFLSELLAAYESFFYERYGYNRSLEESISSIDYEEYDYISAIDVLDNRLISLRAYLASLSNQDNTRFVSTATGLSFADLIQSIDTIRTGDVNWTTSYIVSNNITKDRADLIDYYRYKIGDAIRELVQRQSRLYTLSTQIEGYEKTNAIFLGLADTGEQNGSTSGYEFPQASQMYDALINEKIACETSISETQERIALYEQRTERLQSGVSMGNQDVVEANLRKIDEKVMTFLEDARKTSDEFFRTVSLKRAFQVVNAPKSGLPIIRILLDAFYGIFYVESALLGLFALATLKSACGMARRRETALDGTAGEGHTE